MESLSMILPLITICALLVVLTFLIRKFGAWMLRIDEVIELQREQIRLLKNISEAIQEKINSENRETNHK